MLMGENALPHMMQVQDSFVSIAKDTRFHVLYEQTHVLLTPSF
jgi:hypothetical protein